MVLSLAAALLIGAPAAAHAQDWPSRPIRFIVPVAPGGATDVTARILQDPIAKALGVPIIVENKPGGAGVIATESVVRSAPDGYTFAIVYTSHAGNPALLASVPYDSVKDITPVAFVWRAYLAFSVNKDVPINSIAERWISKFEAPRLNALSELKRTLEGCLLYTSPSPRD